MEPVHALVLACALHWSAAASPAPGDGIPQRDEVEQVLVPLSVGEFDGAFGSHFVLRVRETSRSSSSAGVDIPTPRESASPARMRLQLLNVPVEPGFRHTLRIFLGLHRRDERRDGRDDHHRSVAQSGQGTGRSSWSAGAS